MSKNIIIEIPIKKMPCVIKTYQLKTGKIIIVKCGKCKCIIRQIMLSEYDKDDEICAYFNDIYCLNYKCMKKFQNILYLPIEVHNLFKVLI